MGDYFKVKIVKYQNHAWRKAIIVDFGTARFLEIITLIKKQKNKGIKEFKYMIASAHLRASAHTHN